MALPLKYPQICPFCHFTRILRDIWLHGTPCLPLTSKLSGHAGKEAGKLGIIEPNHSVVKEAEPKLKVQVQLS